MRVELGVFSGQPNPVWTLSEGERAELLEQFGALPRIDADVSQAGLGYRGLAVIAESGETAPFERAIAFEGLIRCETGGGEWTLLDQGRQFERWLLNAGRSYLDEDLFRFIDRIIGH
jgi:hypothetical protein